MFIYLFQFSGIISRPEKVLLGVIFTVYKTLTIPYLYSIYYTPYTFFSKNFSDLANFYDRRQANVINNSSQF